MAYQATNNPDVIIDLTTGAFIPRGNYLWPEDESQIQPAPAPTFADYATAFMGNFGSWIEDTVHANAYDSSLSCASYVTSAVQQFKQDADALVAWRDALWVWAAQWQQGFNGAVPTTIPTWDEVKAQAPQPEAYGWVVHPQGQIITPPAG